MPEEILIPPTSAEPSLTNPSIADLRKMLSGDGGGELEELASSPSKPQSPVTPKEPEKSEAESGTAEDKEAEEEPNKLSEAQIDRRFAKYTKKADDAIRERDLARQESEFLRRELIATRNASPGA